MAVPLPASGSGATPELLSELIAAYARHKPPCRVILAFDALTQGEDGDPRPVLIAEARDRWGTRLFLLQPFTTHEGRVEWGEPVEGGWRDPGEQEMILDAAFAAEPTVTVEAAPVTATATATAGD